VVIRGDKNEEGVNNIWIIKRNLKKNNGKKVFGTFKKLFIHILGVKKIFGKKWESLF
jgi:hypothetical protein